jgi:hypothetical protein
LLELLPRSASQLSIMHLAFFRLALFLSYAVLVRRAQHEFFKNDAHRHSLRDLFPFEGGSAAKFKDAFDDVSYFPFTLCHMPYVVCHMSYVI